MLNTGGLYGQTGLGLRSSGFQASGRKLDVLSSVGGLGIYGLGLGF